MVERVLGKDEVTGSIPVNGSILSPAASISAFIRHFNPFQNPSTTGAIGNGGAITPNFVKIDYAMRERIHY